ncbi:beta-1,4-galactosyltransferase 5-like [Strongylocentrotus purpuratus]|uniref:Beta-1,4-galactosyltransferase n=1 Tax=Strongylocentrotus purpuratus TaxID=7668 RepID=A0A7M7NX80_STRPU|nr:beta-1,4-galactosyltransferase 5-like [Strongylocentrotus purpuratus]
MKLQIPAVMRSRAAEMTSQFWLVMSHIWDTMSDGRVVGRAFFWYIWIMVVMATVSTLALWASLDASYGHPGVVHRYAREAEEGSGLVDSLRRLSYQIDGAFTRPRTVDVKARKLIHGPVCPEIDIPGSEKNLTHELNETTMFHVEERVLHTHTMDARRLTQHSNEKLQKLYQARKINTASGAGIPDVLNDGLETEEYILLPGGHWIPTKCSPRWKVAIVIPFRDRHQHLPILLLHLVPFLKSQYLEFSIFVIEQENDLRFNRAMLMNVGFVEALNYTMFDCFIFHDVDHIPLNYGNLYGCSGMPRHFVSGVDRWNYRLLYGAFFGAVTGFTRTQIEKFNGFPNAYWGWGGEDDDILGRIRAKGLSKTRPWGPVGFYNVIPHHHKSAKKNMDRVCLLNHYKERMETDGLSNLYYGTPSVQLYPLYTNIGVDIQDLPWNVAWHVCDRDAELFEKILREKDVVAGEGHILEIQKEDVKKPKEESPKG